MGLDRIVRFAAGKLPPWSVVSARLTLAGCPVQLRMIDGQLAFPDEAPPDAWRELRVATPAGMITMRREPERITCVVWGNADGALLQGLNTLVEAWAAAGEGEIVGPAG